MQIRNTRDTMSEVYFDALKIRNQVFVKEQKVPYELEMESPIDEAMSVHFVLYNSKNKACGTVRLLTEKKGRIVTMQRMAVLKEERGKNYAAALIIALLQFAKEHHFQEIFLHAQLPARGLYEKFSFVPEGKVFEEAGIQHIGMRKKLK